MLRHLSSEERRTLANRGALKRKNPGKIRLSVFRSARHIEIQAIDDVKGHTLCAASTKEKDFKGKGWIPYVYTIVSALNFNSNGTLTCINFGCSEIIDTEDLFDDYEWKFGLDCEWRPFGVEE